VTAVRRQGFTLVELLVVLAVAALVMTLVPPLLNGARAGAELTATAREIAAKLRETRSHAVRVGRSEVFLVDVRSGAFRAAGDALRHVPSGIRLSLLSANDERIDAGTGGIRFFADGSSTGGAVRLSQGERQSSVAVDWLTGRVSFAPAQH
jgi:general secretion pathway protein H